MTRTRLLLVLVMLLLPLAVYAAEFIDYPEFRYASGLPGGGFGVSPEGHVGFDGALQLNIPIGYTPGWGNAAIAASSANINGGFPTSFSGVDVNGTLTIGFGMFGKNALWFSHMGTGEANFLEPAQNVQYQLVPETKDCPGISIGVIDLFNGRTKSLLTPFAGNARSYFVAATREFGTEEHPLYATLGFGNGRFHTVFAGLSYQPLDRLKLLAEYDGWNPNVGAAWDAIRTKQWHALLMLGVVDMDRWDASLAITYTKF